MGTIVGNINAVGRKSTSRRPPFYADLDTWHKGITDNDFAESINNLPAKFLPRVGSSNGSSEKLEWTIPLSNLLTSWTVAFRMNDFQEINSFGFAVGGFSFRNIAFSLGGFISFRDSNTTYNYWDGSGNTIVVSTASIKNTNKTLLFRTDGINVYLYIDGVYKGYVTPFDTKLFFDSFILGYSDDTNGADGNFWDLRFWNSDIGNTEALKYHLDTITVNPTNWFPDVYSGYDVVGGNHATSNLDYDYELQGSLYLNDNGYSLWQLAANPDIQVPFDINGDPLSLTAGVDIPAGYTKTRDIVAGGSKWNMADALIDFDPDVGTSVKVDMFDRSNATIQTAASRASLFYNAGFPYQYQVNEIADPRIYDTFFETAYKDRVFGKVALDGTDLIRLDEMLNYTTQKTGSGLTSVTNYCKISDIYP